MSHISGRFSVRFLVLVGIVVVLMAAIACGSDDADDPTATPTPTATVTASPTPVPSEVELRDMGCTQTYPGAFNPDGPASFVSMSAKIANTGEADVAVAVSTLGGAIVFLELFDSQGDSIDMVDDTALNIQSLVAGEEYEVSLNLNLFDSVGVATCEFGILSEDRYSIELAGEFSVDAVQIFAP